MSCWNGDAEHRRQGRAGQGGLLRRTCPTAALYPVARAMAACSSMRRCHWAWRSRSGSWTAAAATAGKAAAAAAVDTSMARRDRDLGCMMVLLSMAWQARCQRWAPARGAADAVRTCPIALTVTRWAYAIGPRTKAWESRQAIVGRFRPIGVCNTIANDRRRASRAALKPDVRRSHELPAVHRPVALTSN